MKFDVIAHNGPAIMIFNAMCEKASKRDLVEVFSLDDNDRQHADVVLTVNGIELDVAHILNNAWQQLVSRQEERAKEMAIEMISLAGLSELQDKLSRAEWEIGQAITEALDKLKEQS